MKRSRKRQPRSWEWWLAVVGSAAVLIAVALITGTVRFAKSAAGLLVLALVAYFWAETWWGIAPLSPGAAVLEVDSWRSEERIAVFTTLLTVVGFLLAFITAHWSNVQASQRQLRNEAQEEVRVFFDSAFKCALTIQSAAERLLELQTMIRTDCVIDDVQLALTVYRESYAELVEAQSVLARRALDVSSLRTKHGILFNAFPLAGILFDKAARRLKTVTRVRVFPMPNPKYSREGNLEYLLDCNPRKFRTAIKVIKGNSIVMLGYMGGATGKLGSGVFGISPISWLLMGWSAWKQLQARK